MSDNRSPDQVVDEQIRAYNDRDIDAFVEWYAEDAVVARLPSGEVVAEGTAEIREGWGELFQSTPDLHCEVTDRFTMGEFVACVEDVAGMDEPLTALGLYQVRDGKIQRLWLAQED